MNSLPRTSQPVNTPNVTNSANATITPPVIETTLHALVIRNIRQRYYLRAEMIEEIAARFGVSVDTVRDIVDYVPEWGR